MAERMGFEPTEPLLAVHRFSKPAHSTTLPPLRSRKNEQTMMVGIPSSETISIFSDFLKIVQLVADPAIPNRSDEDLLKK